MNDSSNMIRQDKKLLNITVFDCFAILYFIHKLLPSVGYYMPSFIFLGIFVLLFLFSIHRISKMKKTNELGKMALIFLIVLPDCIQYIVTGNFMGLPIYLYGQLQILLFGLVILGYDHVAQEHKKKDLFYFIILCYALTAVTTIIGNIRYPMASRFLATGDPLAVSLYTSQNIGGFTFAYELVLIIPLLIYAFKNGVFSRWISAGLIILFGYAIIKAEYTMALLYFILSLILFLIPRLTTRKIYVIIAIFVILFIFSGDYIADLLRQLSRNVRSEIFSTRFEEIAAFFEGNDNADMGNAANRFERYKSSFDSFVNTGFMGIWGRAGYGRIGGHSFILDIMGQFGVLGIVAMILMYGMIYTMFVKPYRSKGFYAYYFYVYLTAIVLAVLNTKVHLFVFIVIFPLFAKIMDEVEIKNLEDNK